MATSRALTQTAADLMTAAPRTCSIYSTVLEAVMIFRDAECGAVPVLDDGKPVGILTDRDVALSLADHANVTDLQVTDIMTQGVVTIEPEATLVEIQAKFTEHAVRRLLVVDPDGQLVGIVSWSDVAPWLDNASVGQVVTDVVAEPGTGPV
ncbi:CBS domain-containing protein [Isosphaeraceae bacterium EP7]